ncbi:MAG: ATP-binding protein [Acidimicrobiales bacterium]
MPVIGGPWDHRGISDQSVPPDPKAPATSQRHHRAWWRGPHVPGPWRRSTGDRMVAGVAGGIAERFGLDPTVVRIALALLSIGGGTGVGAYMLGWLLIPKAGSNSSIVHRAASDRRTVLLGVAFATVVVAVVLAASATGVRVVANLIWPTALTAAGLVAVWRGADDEEKSFLRAQSEGMPILSPPGQRSVLAIAARIGLGVVLVALGLSSLTLVRRPILGGETVVSGAAVFAGFAILFGPWWVQVARDLGEERKRRWRAEERAEMASTVHDSVLQTLALIQKASGDPREVMRLARAQERDLRSLLFDGRAPGSFDGDRLSDAVHALEQEVEVDHGVAVEAVVVGDCELSEPVRALVAAGREAVVNAAKWSESPTVSLFVEAEASRVSMFVRDRGKGFDRASVGPDRKGISESIESRMARAGGHVTIRSAPGTGTEVSLVIPLVNGKPVTP